MMGDASDDEITDHVAEAMSLTAEQRTEMIPSGVETKLRNRISWAVLELKHIGVLHYPSRGRRALTSLGLEVNKDRIRELHAEYEASKSSPGRERAESPKPTESPTVWLIRAGGRGELAESFVENGIAAVGFGELGDLAEVSSRDEILELVKLDWPESSDGQARARANQLWALLSQVRRGDVVVMPSMNNSGFALGTVTEEYWHRHDAADMRHAVSVDWKPDEVPRTALRQDLLKALGLRPTINLIRSDDHARRVQQLLETGQDPGPRPALDLPDLVEQFYRETGYPTDAHVEQKRLRAAWAEKLAPENVGSLTPEDLLAYTSAAVDYGQYVTLKEGLQQQWIDDLDAAEYNRLLVSIHDLCWGDDELSIRIDRLTDRVGGFNKDTGIKGFTGLQVSRTLAICHPEQFLPLPSQIGKWGREVVLRALGLPAVHGSYGRRVVDANNRLREHLAPYFEKDTARMVAFINWFKGKEIGGLDPELSDLVERFRAKSGYPTEAHQEQERLRAEWAEKLTSENVESLSREDLTAFTNNAVNNGEYVRRVGGVMRWIRNLGKPEFENLLDNIRHLCWGQDDLSVRFDQLYLDDSPRKVKGYAGVNISRTLAICHPSSFLPVHRNVGNWGRAKMLSRLGLPAPLGNTPGQRVVDANDRLREHLEPHFGDDTLGMGAFLGWLLEQEPPGGTCTGLVGLTKLAGDLLVDVDFLTDIVSLLEDKGQVILYGPPGTGKTYLARALAKVLAPEESRRMLVQFHPSTSYEDFFEGYRPTGTDGGAVQYKLTQGPLARMADQADDAPEDRHVMIIDEINRGNLPRVLGELLFLLEYRNESVQPLYRPDEPFSLPDNLWFIGTMNTADRSIALVDAALRRRFHFVPFFPDREPMAGLLGRWLERQGGPGWVGDLVDEVNEELKEVLEGSHLLLGPSHFMKKYGSSPNEQRRHLRRIWEYNIEPFIEDQFFGDPDRIVRFQFDAVMKRHGPASGSDVNASDDDDRESTDDSGGEHAAVDGDAAADPGSAQPEYER